MPSSVWLIIGFLSAYLIVYVHHYFTKTRPLKRKLRRVMSERTARKRT